MVFESLCEAAAGTSEPDRDGPKQNNLPWAPDCIGFKEDGAKNPDVLSGSSVAKPSDSVRLFIAQPS